MVSVVFCSVTLHLLYRYNTGAVLCRTFARLAEDPAFHFSLVLEPGVVELIHNPTILHSRADVEDGEVRPAVLHC